MAISASELTEELRETYRTLVRISEAWPATRIDAIGAALLEVLPDGDATASVHRALTEMVDLIDFATGKAHIAHDFVNDAATILKTRQAPDSFKI